VPGSVSTLRRFLLPDLGEGLTHAEVVAWRVAVGDEVALNQVLVEVETEKAVVELPSPCAGTVQELLAGPGDSVAVGEPLIAIAVATAAVARPGAGEEPDRRGIEGSGEPPSEPVTVLVGSGPAPTPPSRRRRKGAHRAGAPTPTPAGPPNGTRPLAAPPVRYMARQNGIDLASVTGRGPGGIVTRDDLAAHLARTEAAHDAVLGGEERETRTPVRGVQKHMAESMVRSVASAPQACVFLSLDVTPAVHLVERLRANPRFDGVRITPLAVVARSVVLALREHPSLNSSWDEATEEVVTKHYVNLGVAVAGPTGLLVPNVKDAHTMSLRALAGALEELVARARAGRCTPADLRGGTATLSNVGVFGVDGGVPILNPGEAVIVALGAIGRRPWEHEGAVALREVVTLSVAFDHRLVDGEGASRFLATVGEILADPTNLLALS
jgi:2-oxoisovalerate dehydrogenase E2 component (dihydrolipoyl transacylase)